MKYETMGGGVKDTNEAVVRLSELRPGERFTSKSGKTVFVVIDQKCRFNRSAGSATRACLNTQTNMPENKLCRIEVIKVKP
jgi:hypothetical protein